MSVQLDIVDQTIEVQIVEDEVVNIAIWNGISVQANGTFVAKTRILNFSSGSSLSVSEEGNKVNIVIPTGGGGGSGTVTSVGDLSPLFTTANPTTTPTFTAVNQNANLVYAGPATGGAAAPTFRALVAADLPSDSTAYWKAASGVALTGTNTISGAQTVAFTNTEVTFLSSVLKIRNPANTFSNIIASGAIPANRTITIPVLGANGFFLAGDSTQIVANRVPVIGAGDGQVISSANFTFVTNRILGTTLYLTVSAGTATAGTAPLKMTSGTNLTTAEAGAFEYNGTNLFFTRTGTTRENIVCASAVNSVSPTAPDRTITVNINGTTLYVHAKTTND